MVEQHSQLLRRFIALEIDAASFGHREHVQVAFEMLHRYDYLDVCTLYANNIKAMAENAGASNQFNVTITFAFLSLIAQRLSSARESDFERFIQVNADLLNRDILKNWYSTEALRSEFARTHFLLPMKDGGSNAYGAQCR